MRIQHPLCPHPLSGNEHLIGSENRHITSCSHTLSGNDHFIGSEHAHTTSSMGAETGDAAGSAPGRNSTCDIHYAHLHSSRNEHLIGSENRHITSCSHTLSGNEHLIEHHRAGKQAQRPLCSHTFSGNGIISCIDYTLTFPQTHPGAPSHVLHPHHTSQFSSGNQGVSPHTDFSILR